MYVFVAVAPDPPTIVSVERGNEEVSINIIPPDNDGGKSVVGYRVQVSPSGVSFVTDVIDSTIVVNSLTNGVEYGECVREHPLDNCATRNCTFASSAQCSITQDPDPSVRQTRYVIGGLIKTSCIMFV